MKSSNIETQYKSLNLSRQVIKVIAYILLLWVLTNLISSIIIKLIIEGNHIFKVYLYFMYGSILSVIPFILLGLFTFFFVFLLIGNKWWLVLASVLLTLFSWVYINNDWYSLIDRTPIVYSLVISILTIVFSPFIKIRFDET